MYSISRQELDADAAKLQRHTLESTRLAHFARRSLQQAGALCANRSEDLKSERKLLYVMCIGVCADRYGTNLDSGHYSGPRGARTSTTHLVIPIRLWLS